MANLRSLIGAVSVTDIKPLQDNCTMYFFPHCQCYCNSDYGGNCYLNWCVPAGTTKMKMEVWGGGGSGAGACCCMAGTPGGSGAWAYKCLNSTDDFSAGDLYNLYPGPATCCASCCCGIIGCKGYVEGNGLTGFCADGGNAGQTCCFIHWGWSDCVGNRCGYYYTNRMCCVCCRCHYGSDGGSPGRPSAIWAQCTCGSCWWKHLYHYPGGINNNTGGFTTTQSMGNACNNEWSRCVVGNIGWATGQSGNIPGLGGPSATSCGGGCCYGYPGSSGLVRITYDQS